MGYRYKSGIGEVGPYQVAGKPFLTGSTALSAGSEDRIEFPSVAKEITIINTSSTNLPLRIHYNSITDPGGVLSGLHFVTLQNVKDSFTLSMKCKQIFISAPGTNGDATSYELVAELTGIDVEQMPPLTGSGLTD